MRNIKFIKINTNRHLFKSKINGHGKIQTQVFTVEKIGQNQKINHHILNLSCKSQLQTVYMDKFTTKTKNLQLFTTVQAIYKCGLTLFIFAFSICS